MSKNLFQHFYLILFFFMTTVMSCTSVFAIPNAEGIQSYQKNMYLSPEHKQKLADDITRYRNADNLWDVLREEFSLPHYDNNPAVQEKIQWFMNNQDFLLRSASRAAPYLYYILQQVKKRHLPAELVLMPIVESGYNPFSLSNMGAAGIWQLMPGTATGLGVRSEWGYDGRRDVIASTHAALSYLAYLQSFFDGNWLLAMAAYNTGEGNISSAIRRNISNGLDTDFWSLPIAQQTKDYVPSILALAVILSNPDRYPIYFPPVRNAPYLAEVEIDTQLNLKYAAKLAGISYQKIIQLNPAYFKGSTTSRGQTKLILPIENVQQFSENLATSPLKQPINWIHYKVRPGDNLAMIAKKFSTSVGAIRKLNRLTAKNNLRRVNTLLIPTSDLAQDPAAAEEIELPQIEVAANIPKSSLPKKRVSQDVVIASEDERPIETGDAPVVDLSSNNAPYALQPGDTVYMVRSKDTLASIAKRFNVSPTTLRFANKLGQRKLQPGKELIIPTHTASTATLEASADNSLRPGDTVYMVRHGDTIEKIAKRYRTTPSAIRLTNFMERNTLRDGERLVIPTHMSG